MNAAILVLVIDGVHQHGEFFGCGHERCTELFRVARCCFLLKPGWVMAGFLERVLENGTARRWPDIVKGLRCGSNWSCSILCRHTKPEWSRGSENTVTR